MTRVRVRSEDRRRVLRLFERECAVCGTRDAIDVAHLFEDATLERATAARLLLLCPTHNQAEERAHGRAAPPLPAIFNPDRLIAESRADYRNGRYHQAYPKARLAAYLYEEVGYHSEAVDCLNEAASAARPVRWGDFLAATAFEVERLCLSYHIGIAVRWIFLERLALTLYDYSRWREGLDVVLAAQVLLKRSPRNDYSPEKLEFDKDISFRRHALLKACNQAFARGETLSKLTRRLVSDASKFKMLGHFDEWAKNLGMARRLIREMKGDPDEAHRYVEEVLDCQEKITHKWELMEQRVSAATYLHSKNDRKAAFGQISQALNAYNQHPLLLEPVLETGGPKQYQLHDHLQRLGITYEVLLEYGVPIYPPIDQVPLGLNEADIRRVVKAVL